MTTLIPFPRLLAFLFIMIAVIACKKSELPHPPPDNTSNEPVTSITFKTIEDSLVISGVFVGITPNSTDRDNGVFLKSGTSSSSGRITFSDLLGITYYYNASYAATSGPVNRSGSITLEEGDRVNRDLNF